MRHTRRLLVMIYALCLALVLRAQTKPTVLPVTSTEGYDFYATFLPNGNAQRTAIDLKLQFLVSARAVPGHPEITHDTIGVQCGLGSNEEYYIPVNSTEVIDIQANYAYWDIIKQYSEVEKPLNYGVHIFSKNNVKTTVYSFNQAGSDKTALSLDGSHVLPKQALGHEYIVSCNSEDVLATEFVIMSTEANTKVTIQLPQGVKTTTESSGTLEATFTQPYMIYIVRSLAADADNPVMDLSGATICADKPVAVWSGNAAARFTTDAATAKEDHAYDQLLPINHWGKEFIVPLTGLHTQLNKLDITAWDNETKVTITTSQSTQTKTLKSAEKWERLLDAFHTKGLGFTLEDSTVVVKADKPIQVRLHTSSSAYNGYLVNNIPQYVGDASTTMITPLEHLTDTAVFTTYKNSVEDMDTMNYELVVWAKKSTVSSLKLYDGNTETPVSSLTSFKNFPGWASSGYQYARIPIDKTKAGNFLRLTAAEKGFGGYVCGLEDGQACLYPIGYSFATVVDSLFLSKRYEPKEVHGAEFSTKYPDKANGGGWYVEKIDLPNKPAQYDTIFICDSAKLRFPAIIHNDWDSIKWEVMRIDQSTQRRSIYKHEDDDTYKYEYKEGDLKEANPFVETRFFVLPEKNMSAQRRHPYEDFEVRAVLYRRPILCDQGEDKDKWQKDTLSTIVRTYRSYNDTTWLIRCSNDNDIVKTGDQYSIKYFVDPKTKEGQPTLLNVGENGPFTYKYTTVNGCENDSIVTLYVLLCESEIKEVDMGYICEDELKDLRDHLDGFFMNFDFYGTFYECRTENKNMYGWTSQMETKQAWHFEKDDVIRTTDCNDLMQKWHNDYGAAYPRNTLGCDRKLLLTMNVLPVKEYEDEYTTCENQYLWSFDYHWHEGRQEFIEHKDIWCRFSDPNMHEGNNDTIYEYKKDNPNVGGTCVAERHILHLTFIRDNNPHIKSISLCQDADPLIVNKESDPDIANEQFEWIFNPKEYTPGVHYSDPILCINDKNCEYKLQYKITVNAVDTHLDTVVYCYDDGAQVEHKWEGHTSFWANIKGQPNTRKRYDADHPLRINRPKEDRTKDTRIVYELADTIPGSPCHDLYYQTVILLPPYSTSEKRDPISTEQWFEWHDVIWIGEKVNKDTIPNPSGKKIIKLVENQYSQEVPEGWTVDYLKGDYLYALTTTATTRQYRSETGLTAPCDSTVQLLVQIADVQRDSTYEPTCSDNSPYEWQAGDTTILVDLKEYYTHLTDLPVAIELNVDRKTVDDATRTVSPWPVAGIDAHFYRHLTIFPAYLMTEDTTVCQGLVPGEKRTFKGKEFSIDQPGVLEAVNRLVSKHIWVHPRTGDKVEVPCDSLEGVRMFVNPIYTENINKDLSTHQRTLYSHDTLTFFTEPKILYVGQDFFYTHPDVRDLDELKNKAGVSEAIVIDSTLVDALHRTSADRWGLYSDKQLSSGTKELSCDSTTFLDLTVYKTQIIPPVNLGDNGEVLEDGENVPWSFGGISALGHSHPYITGDYFRFYYDENGNVIVDDDGNPYEVNYTDDYDRARDQRHWDYHANEDGTRTYLLVDSVLQADGTYNVIVQYITVYPTFKVNANDIEGLGIVEKCQTDEFKWENHKNKDGSDFMIDVSKLNVNSEREAEVRDTLCAKRYADRIDRLGNSLCVDSIAILKLKVFGNGKVEQTHSRCFNDSIWAPDWKPAARVYYTAGGGMSQKVDDALPSEGSGGLCKDSFVVIVTFKPAYGIAPYKWGDQADSIRHRNTYIQPYIYDTIVCKGDDNFQWLVKQGDTYVKHTPTNLYLYKYDGRYNDEPDSIFFDAQGKKTNKVPGNKIPSNLEVNKSYTVRDSLKTKGTCHCDSVLTLNYELLPAPDPLPLRDVIICDGEAFPFGDTLLYTPGLYVRNIETGDVCKAQDSVNLIVVEASSFMVDPAPVCFPSRADIDTTYALHYSYWGAPPTSFSVYYDDDAKAIGFRDIVDQTITESNWTAGNEYVLDLPMPRVSRDRQNYPTPGTYSATIGFKNGVCLGDSLMTDSFKVKINYPSWVMIQRHGDLIVLLDVDYNGGHAWNNFEWYENGKLMSGYTKPYLYVPEGLVVGAEYHAVLTETDLIGNIISSAPTCPIIAKEMPSSGMGPTSDYIAVTPTCVPLNGEDQIYIHVLSNENGSGDYRVSTVEGQYVTKGKFEGKATPVKMPTAEGMYIVQVWSSNKESKESYRAVKVIVRKTCPNCDKSSF